MAGPRAAAAWRPLARFVQHSHQQLPSLSAAAAIARSFSSTAGSGSVVPTAPWQQLVSQTAARSPVSHPSPTTTPRSPAFRYAVAQVRRQHVRLQSTVASAAATAIDPTHQHHHATSGAAAAEGSTFPDPPEVPLTSPLVSKYLFVIAGLVFAIVVVGGMTRLTESGLSITEWNVVKGVKLPMTRHEWEVEFDKYKATPEWKM